MRQLTLWKKNLPFFLSNSSSCAWYLKDAGMLEFLLLFQRWLLASRLSPPTHCHSACSTVTSVASFPSAFWEGGGILQVLLVRTMVLHCFICYCHCPQRYDGEAITLKVVWPKPAQNKMVQCSRRKVNQTACRDTKFWHLGYTMTSLLLHE